MTHFITLNDNSSIILNYDKITERVSDYGFVYFQFFLYDIKIASINKFLISEIIHYKNLFSMEKVIDYKKGEG